MDLRAPRWLLKAKSKKRKNLRAIAVFSGSAAGASGTGTAFAVIAAGFEAAAGPRLDGVQFPGHPMDAALQRAEPVQRLAPAVCLGLAAHSLDRAA